MILDILKDAILQNLGPLKQAPKGWQKRNCMLCHTQGHGRDTRQRFGIQFNPDSIACNCFNCGFSAGYKEGEPLSKGFKFLLRQLSIEEKFIKQVEFEIFKLKNQISEVRDGESKLINKEARLKELMGGWQPMELPDDSLPISTWLEMGLDDPDFMKVTDYALSRKIFDLDNFYWTPNKEKRLHERLIIPYYYKQKIVGFTSRLCYDTPDKSIPKYFQQCPQDFVYNLDPYQDRSRKYVLVTEGVLDAWCIDGVATLGEIGQAKTDIINRLQKEVIVCPDFDKKGWDLVEVAIANNWSVSFPNWGIEIKDAAKATEKYGRLLTTHSIISSAVSGRERIEINWKIRINERQRHLN